MGTSDWISLASIIISIAFSVFSYLTKRKVKKLERNVLAFTVAEQERVVQERLKADFNIKVDKTSGDMSISVTNIGVAEARNVRIDFSKLSDSFITDQDGKVASYEFIQPTQSLKFRYFVAGFQYERDGTIMLYWDDGFEKGRIKQFNLRL